MISAPSSFTEPPAWVNREAYPFESRWLELASGGRMHYVDEGSGEVVLLVHGTPTWSFEWRHLIRSLAAGYRCVAPDHVGFGLSERPRDGAYTPEWHAGNLAEFVSRLGLRDVTLVVHDYGGRIRLPLALDRRHRAAPDRAEQLDVEPARRPRRGASRPHPGRAPRPIPVPARELLAPCDHAHGICGQEEAHARRARAVPRPVQRRMVPWRGALAAGAR
jgi:pimeloyl-ACP methyl ester carboxylesterase